MAILLKLKYRPIYFSLLKIIDLSNVSVILKQRDIVDRKYFFKQINSIKKKNKKIIRNSLEDKVKNINKYDQWGKEYILASYLEKIIDLAFLWQQNFDKEAEAILSIARSLKNKILHIDTLEDNSFDHLFKIKQALLAYFTIQIHAPRNIIDSIISFLNKDNFFILSFVESKKDSKVVILSKENQFTLDIPPYVIEKTFKHALIKYEQSLLKDKNDNQ